MPIKTILPDDATFVAQLDAFTRNPEAQNFCVVAFDINHFRLLNEYYGWAIGNHILQNIAQRIKEINEREHCFAGYFGNDDFLMVLPNDDNLILSVRDDIQNIITLENNTISFGIKIGACTIADCPQANSYDLCNYAQIAIAVDIKSNEQVPRFDINQLDEAKKQLEILADIEEGIYKDQFTFFLQPQCNSDTRTIIGMEALVRWIHPTRGIVPPGKFIPILERTGLIVDLDTIIWDKVCKTLQRWIQTSNNVVPISINVSIADIQAIDVTQYLIGLCEKYGVPHKMLRIEITESMMAQSMQEISELTSQLRENGFTILMDDFGSGYSSLNMLKDANVDVIKLDMKLIELNAENFGKGRQIVESVVDMAHQLGLPVVAEGVENQTQLRMLQSLDCIYTQGFKFFKPMPVENAEVLLAQPGTNQYWDLALDSEKRNVKTVRYEFVGNVAAHTCEILSDYLLILARANLITGNFELLNCDSALPAPLSGITGNMQEYADLFLTKGVVAPEFEREFRERTNVERLRSLMLSGARQRLFTFRTTLGGDYEWLTLGFTGRKDCSPQNPWCVFFVRKETMDTLPAQTLGQSFEYDTLTGLYNYEKYKNDLRNVGLHHYDCISCAYLDVIGLHEINNHIGHAAGDRMLERIGTELKMYFPEARSYRLGGDEFLVLAPNASEDAIENAISIVKHNLELNNIDISCGVSSCEQPQDLLKTITNAEQKMLKNKRKHYAKDGKGRQLRMLNTQLEDSIQEQQDAEQCFSMILPNCTGVYVVNMLDDKMRCVRAPEGFKQYGDMPGATFTEAARKYTEDSILPKYQSIVLDLLDYDAIRNFLWSGQKIKRYYERKDGECFELEIYPYSKETVYKDYSLWVFTRVPKDE